MALLVIPPNMKDDITPILSKIFQKTEEGIFPNSPYETRISQITKQTTIIEMEFSDYQSLGGEEGKSWLQL